MHSYIWGLIVGYKLVDRPIKHAWLSPTTSYQNIQQLCTLFTHISFDHVEPSGHSYIWGLIVGYKLVDSPIKHARLSPTTSYQNIQQLCTLFTHISFDHVEPRGELPLQVAWHWTKAFGKSKKLKMLSIPNIYTTLGSP
jgi:predicted aminopeptidase